MNFTLEGAAEFGVDFTTIPDLTPFFDPGTEVYTVVIPAGETSFEFEIITLDDGLGEGVEEITISLIDQLCDGFEFQSSVDFAIEEELNISLDPDDSTICNGQCVDLVADVVTEGNATFTWDPVDGLSDPNSLTPEACPTVTTTYTITNNLSDCVATESITITVEEPTINFIAEGVTCEDGNNGSIDVTVDDAVEPITYTWTYEGMFFSNDQNITDLETGEYCLTIVDANGCTTEDCIDVIEVDLLNVSNVEFCDFTCFPISCFGACDGSIEITIEGGIAPYSSDLNGTVVAGATPLFDNLCAGTYDIVVTDAIGCEITVQYTLDQPDELEIEVVGSTDVLCNGEETGLITVTTTGGCPPYTYEWSHDPNLTTPIATELPAGEFTVTVTDVNGCVSAESVTIVINGPGDPIGVTVDNVSLYPGGFNVSCPGASDGSIDITITGGTPPYLPTWTHQESGTTYVNVEDLTNLPCGTYDLLVRDDNDCEFELEVELTCVPDFDLVIDVIPNPCGDPNAGIGEIDVTVSGAHGGPYTFDWSGPSCPCAGSNITGLISGDYTLTVEDQFGCDTTVVINVGTNDQFNVTPTITDATCGGTCDGSIEIEVSGLVPDMTVWSGPDGFTSNDEDIFNLCAGSYILTVTSAGCEEQFVYVVNEPDPIVIDFIDVVPPLCFGQNNGSLEIDISGGTGNLTATWQDQPDCFFTETTGTSINNLFECTYVVVVEDEAGCSVTDSIFLDAPQVMDIFVSISDFGGPYNVSCNGASDGSISVSVNGGTQDCIGFAPECYFYDWTSCDPVNIPGLSQQQDLPAGSYCVVVTDANGCVATTEIDLVQPDPIESSGAISDYNGFGVSCNGECDGFISPEITGGNDNYVIYDWITGDIGDNDAQADTLFNLCPGIYELRIVDNNDCEEIISFELTE
ncbi:MAG: SprB repeat-containing protein, partial [Flavobacteriales bacterium]|nr:SprB repeat-containing protein [Flavobacteriales bacterium]